MGSASPLSAVPHPAPRSIPAAGMTENPTLSVIFFAAQKIVLNILSMSNVKKRHMVAMNVGCNSELLENSSFKNIAATNVDQLTIFA